MKILGAWALLALAVGAFVVGCTDAAAPGTSSQSAATPAATEQRRTTPASPAGAGAIPSAAPATIADLFPPGTGRDAVLNNCGSCHNLACSAIGQRTTPRWDALRESHKERGSDADLGIAFTYLKANFNDSKPEPKVPPMFLEGGCTPF